jgi:hypothetical protein
MKYSEKQNTNNNIEMIVTDLDGTLFNDDHSIENKDLDTLNQLKDMNILRVIATGRNFYSANKILHKEFPIDYLIFSSGAGIYDWKRRQLIHSEYLPKQQVEEIVNLLIEENVDFMIHEVIPENHKFVFHKTNKKNPDFQRRYELYKDFAVPFDPENETYDHASQLVVIPGKGEDYYEELSEKLANAKCIRTTSPLDNDTLWIEIFPSNVSKGHGVAWLCNYTHTDPTKTVGIGNDYNDLDLLDFTTQSFVVANAPEELKQQYSTCSSNLKCGFTDAVNRALNL